jgi:hypothetical protein
LPSNGGTGFQPVQALAFACGYQKLPYEAIRLTLPDTIYGINGSPKFHQISLIQKLPLPWWEGVGGRGAYGLHRYRT